MSCQTKNSKVCNKCKAEKPETAFSKNRTMKDGLQCQCKMCCKLYQAIYRQTPEGKKTHRKSCRQYDQTPNGREARRKGLKKYHRSAKGKISSKRWRLQCPGRVKARQAVNNAVAASRIPRPDTFQCAYCGKAAQQYHHWHGYDRQHWLDVIPACRKCDKASHKSKETA